MQASLLILWSWWQNVVWAQSWQWGHCAMHIVRWWYGLPFTRILRYSRLVRWKENVHALFVSANNFLLKHWRQRQGLQDPAEQISRATVAFEAARKKIILPLQEVCDRWNTSWKSNFSKVALGCHQVSKLCNPNSSFLSHCKLTRVQLQANHALVIDQEPIKRAGLFC